jgi:hypothetical protein
MDAAKIWITGLVAIVLGGVFLERAVCDESKGLGLHERARPGSYQECVKAGGRIEESHPSRCVIDSGLTFVEPPQGKGGACKDLCGDEPR